MHLSIAFCDTIIKSERDVFVAGYVYNVTRGIKKKPNKNNQRHGRKNKTSVVKYGKSITTKK